MVTPAETLKRLEPKFRLSSSTAFVHPGEREEFDGFTAAYQADLCPQSPLEETLAREIVHASWRLRRCAQIEANPPDAATSEELDRLQTSVDRARAAAQRSLHRSLAELRRVQTERVYRAIALPAALEPDHPGQADCRRLDPPARFIKQVQAADAQLTQHLIENYGQPAASAAGDFAKQTQSQPAAPVAIAASVARNASCPCGSRQKYKRCCGKTAPPVLNARAA